MKRLGLPRKFLLFTTFLLLLFLLLFSTLNRLINEEVDAKHAVFDQRLASFDCEEFKRVRPYLDSLEKRYPLDEKAESSRSPFERATIKYFKNGKKDSQFDAICGELEVIRSKNQTNALKELLKFEATPLTLAAFFLSPLPSIFISPHRAQIMESKIVAGDKLLKYLSALKQPSLLRGYLTNTTWLEDYDKPAFIAENGNVFSFPIDEKSLLLSNFFKNNLSELGTKSSSNDIDELLASASIKLEQIKVDNHINFTVDICDYVVKIKDSQNFARSDALIIKTGPKTIDTYVQISETILIDSDKKFHLKAMIINSNEKSHLMIFDENFQFWTRFDDEAAFSMPRSIARKYFVYHGTHLIYTKQ